MIEKCILLWALWYFRDIFILAYYLIVLIFGILFAAIRWTCFGIKWIHDKFKKIRHEKLMKGLVINE